jgi:hypothetical protein
MTNQNTNTQPIELTVMRDNAIDKDYARTARINYFKGALTHIASIAVEKAENGFTELTTPFKLEVFDAVHGTSLRNEYFEQRHQVAISAMRELVEL